MHLDKSYSNMLVFKCVFTVVLIASLSVKESETVLEVNSGSNSRQQSILDFEAYHEVTKRRVYPGILPLEDAHRKTYESEKAWNQYQEHNLENLTLPESFDARERWTNCPSIRLIKDQGACGSCWAFAAAGAISDRICIQSGQKIKVNVSAENILSCCMFCGQGCVGGRPLMVWRMWVLTGIVTGGLYGSKSGCQPYQIPPCAHHMNVSNLPTCKRQHKTPMCSHNCEEGYSVAYHQDKHFGSSYYRVPNNTQQIMAEIMLNGPVEAAFTLHEDFEQYRSGVYQLRNGSAVIGGHALRLIGWGSENGTDYWLAANSWNEHWGERGYVKFLRGVDQCGIESQVVAGMSKN